MSGLISFNCDSCGQKLNIKAGKAGRTVSCPKCSSDIDVPDPLAREEVLKRNRLQPATTDTNTKSYEKNRRFALHYISVTEAAVSISCAILAMGCIFIGVTRAGNHQAGDSNLVAGVAIAIAGPIWAYVSASSWLLLTSSVRLLVDMHFKMCIEASE
ncbi:hypothetical protein SH668x_000165 [Planctomicrobium sp. SH668]|uniref:hypothetical protein n=1 Tax=Planctomicrobium sp. SH668 TaxID=3448126 RepID=UPI003F5AF293